MRIVFDPDINRIPEIVAETFEDPLVIECIKFLSIIFDPVASLIYIPTMAVVLPGFVFVKL